MAVKHVIIGRVSKNSAPIPVYAGDLASEGEEAKKNFPQCATFEHFEQLNGVTKRNPNYVPAQAEEPIVQDQSEDEAPPEAPKGNAKGKK